MRNDELFHSLSSMAEEYERLVSPLTEYLKIYDRWQDIASPILKVAEMQEDVLKGITAFDTSLAQHLGHMTEPYQPMLNNIAAIENMMGTRFSELVHPQVYVPGIASGLTAFSEGYAQFESGVQHATGVVKAFGQVDSLLEPWKMDLDIVSAFDTSITDSCFSHLVELEKSVAGLAGVLDQFDQMTSISAQLASLQQVELNDSWKSAITPPELMLGLNDFAVKQYEQIRKATDDQSIAWRFGLIDAASKFVDAQVAWGSALAVDFNEDNPEAEIATPDFSDFPVILGHTRRDGIDVVDAFEDSQLMEITGTGKLIVQKAKAINDFCKARRMQLLFPESDLINWAMTLGSVYCRDTETLKDVLDTLNEMFNCKPITDLIGYCRCFTEFESYRDIPESKRQITEIQKRIYRKIISLENDLIKCFEGTECSGFEEDTVSSYVMKALLNVQKDRQYKTARENTINDGIRNQLSMVYEVRDQTRQGDSESGKDAGEVDILLCKDGNPAVIMEGLKLGSFESGKLNDHINKALVNYDPNGCPLVYILIYAAVKEFDVFWNKVLNHMEEYSFPYETVERTRNVPIPYTSSRHARAVLRRNGKTVSVHLFAITMEV